MSTTQAEVLQEKVLQAAYDSSQQELGVLQ
jgi:hypothetical protein